MGNAATASEITLQKNETNTNAPTSKNRQTKEDKETKKEKKKIVTCGGVRGPSRGRGLPVYAQSINDAGWSTGAAYPARVFFGESLYTQPGRSRAFPVPTIFSRFPPSSSGRKLGSEAGLPEIGTPVSKKDLSYLLIPSTCALFLYFFATLKRGTVEVRQNTTPNQRRPSLSGRLTA